MERLLREAHDGDTGEAGPDSQVKVCSEDIVSPSPRHPGSSPRRAGTTVAERQRTREGIN